jgi:hypothetical protein
MKEAGGRSCCCEKNTQQMKEDKCPENNCRAVPINPIIHSRTCYYSSWNPRHITT